MQNKQNVTQKFSERQQFFYSSCLFNYERNMIQNADLKGEHTIILKNETKYLKKYKKYMQHY